MHRLLRVSPPTGALTVLSAAVALLVAASAPAWAQLRPAAYPGEARYIRFDDRDVAAIVDPQTGAPIWIGDTNLLALDPGAPTELRTASDVTRRTEAFLRAHSGTLHVDVATLGPPRIRSYDGLWFVEYGQVIDAKDRWRTRVGMTVDRQGRLVAFGARVLPEGVPESPPGGDDTAIPDPVDPSDLENAPGRTVVGSISIPTSASGDVRAVGDEAGSISGHVTQNAYRTPDNYETPQERLIGVAFRGARVDLIGPLGSTTLFADDEGRFQFTGLPSPGSYTVRFVLENDRARIVQGVPDSSLSVEMPVVLDNPGERQIRDLDWGWGSDGDRPYSATAAALSALYHMRLMDDYLRGALGFEEMASRDRMDVEIRPGPPGGLTYPESHKITLGHPHAMSGEVAMHEYAHNVLFALGGDRGFHNQVFGGDPEFDQREAWAMDEGFADYLACAVTGNYAFGGPGKATGDPSFPPGTGVTIRLLWNDLTASDWRYTYSPDVDHLNGKILSGAVWMVRADYHSDPEIVDRIVFLALGMEPWAQSVGQFARNLFAADRYLTGGRYRQTIERELVGRGLHPPSEPLDLRHALVGTDLVLTWDDRSGVEDGYEIQRRDAGAAWRSIALLPANSTEAALRTDACVDGAPAPEYRVRVFDAESGLEAFSPMRSVDPCGSGVGIEGPDFAGPIPGAPTLDAVYPNPATTSVRIGYSLPTHSPVRIVLYDALGRQMAVLEEADRPPGRHFLDVDVTGIPAGTCYVVLTTPGRRMTGTLAVIR